MSRKKRKKKSHTWIVCLVNASHDVAVRRRFYLFRTLFLHTRLRLFLFYFPLPLLLLLPRFVSIQIGILSIDEWNERSPRAHKSNVVATVRSGVRIRMGDYSTVIFLLFIFFRLLVVLSRLGYVGSDTRKIPSIAAVYKYTYILGFTTSLFFLSKQNLKVKTMKTDSNWILYFAFFSYASFSAA